MNCIAHLCGSEEILESKNFFSSLDLNNDGYITLNELKEALKDKYDDNTLQSIIRSIDTDKNGAINYTEFVAATMNANVITDEQKILLAFEMLDKDGDGFIEERELEELIGQQEYDKSVFKRMISEIDEDSDNKINYSEFRKMVSSVSNKWLILYV